MNEIPAIASLCADVSQPTLDLIRSFRTASPIPRHPDAARRAYKLRQRYIEPRARTLLGVPFCGGTITLAQTCNAAFAALSSFRLSSRKPGDIGERFRSDLSYRDVGVGRPDSGF